MTYLQHGYTISITVSIMFLVALVLFLVVYMKDKELDQERPTIDNNWITGFLVILITGFLISSYIAYDGWKCANDLRKRAFI